MLNHIGITVKNVSEVKNFYQDILGMEILKQFTINSELSNLIFQINEETEVFLMQKDNLILELFIHENTVPKQYNHICVDVQSRNDLIEKTKKYNYTCKIIPWKNFNLVFIKDRLGNNFEVKEI